MSEYNIQHGNLCLYNVYMEKDGLIITEFGFDKLNLQYLDDISEMAFCPPEKLM